MTHHTFHGGGQLHTDHDEQHGVHDEGDERPGGRTVGAVLRFDGVRAVVGEKNAAITTKQPRRSPSYRGRLDLLREQERDEGHRSA